MSLKQMKKEDKIRALVCAFREKGKDGLSIKDIMELFECVRTSAYNYIHYLKKAGYTVPSRTSKRKKIYFLDENSADTPDDISYSSLTKKVLRKYSMIQKLQESPTIKNTFIKKVHEDERHPLGIRSPRLLYELRNELIEEGEIKLNPKDNKYYLTGNNVPLILSTNCENINKLSIELANISPGHPYYTQLNAIYRKASLYLGYIDESDSHYKNYLVYGRPYQEFSRIHTLLQKLSKYDYQNNILFIKYKDKSDTDISVRFATGMIVYCLEKDTLYLLGSIMDEKTYSTDSPDIIINANTITGIEEVTPALKNSCYHSAHFEDIFETMFSISVAEPYEVKVAFDPFGNIKHKVEVLASQRKYAHTTVDETTKELIYTDTVRGLPDFANYLRQFGRSVKVIAPENLRKMMEYTVLRSLERYEEEI